MKMLFNKIQFSFILQCLKYTQRIFFIRIQFNQHEHLSQKIIFVMFTVKLICLNSLKLNYRIVICVLNLLTIVIFPLFIHFFMKLIFMMTFYLDRKLNEYRYLFWIQWLSNKRVESCWIDYFLYWIFNFISQFNFGICLLF